MTYKFSSLGRIGLFLAILAAFCPSAVRAQGAGQTLYNGIVLPPLWPPQGGPTQAYQVPSYITNPPAVIPIDTGRQLFVDDFLIQSTTMTRTQHQPVMYPGNPIITPIATDTTGNAFPYSDGVWYDPSAQLFKMWFYCAGGNMVCYAYSTDGKNWIRPSIPDAVVPNTDQVLEIVGGRDSMTIWMDLQDPNPARRFKAFAYQSGLAYGILIYFSADGIHWNAQVQSTYPIDAYEDRTTLFWNPFRNVWADSMKDYVTLPASGNRAAYTSRARYYLESPDLMNWTPNNANEFASFWTGPDVNDPPYPGAQTLPQLYNLDAVGYESVIVGLFSWYYPGPAYPSDDPNNLPGPALVELGVGFSRDGFQWVRPTRAAGPSGAFIPASNIPGTWDMGDTQSAGGGFLVVGDELWFYFSGRNGPHGESTAGATGLATLRRDGFYSMDAGSTPAVLTTRPLQFSGKYMFVNVNDPQGTLQIQVLNANDQVVATSIPLTANKTLQQVTWNGLSDLSSLADQPLQFQFTLTNGSLYSFWVTSSPSGASNGYIAANGPGFTGPVDNLGSGAYPTSAATPEISPNGGSFANSVTVTMFTGTPGAAIHYTTDGTAPQSSSPLYTGPIQLTGSVFLQAVSTVSGLNNSAIASASFNHDTTPPTISLTQPFANHIVSGSISVVANASDSSGIGNVQFIVDGAIVGSATAVPYSITLDTTSLTNGGHTFSAVAFDSVGNQGTSNPVVVTVDNVTSGPVSGLIGYWSFDPGFVSGNTLFDQSGSNLNLNAFSTTTATGEINQALQFNGTSSWAQVLGGYSAYDLNGSMSFALWVKTSNTSRVEALISKYAAADSGYGYLLRTTAAGTLQLAFGGANVSGGSTIASDVTKINDGNWHHVAVVVNLGTSVSFYIDGTLSSTSTIFSEAEAAQSYFQLGLNPYTPYGQYFTGSMDEVRVYNRALTASDVTALAKPYAPTISIVSPTSGTSVSGSVPVSVSASDTAGIASALLQVDGATVAITNTSPFNFDLDTNTLSNSSHQITVVATDNEGNQATSSFVSLNVNNVFWYVSPTGSSSGNGTLASPWDLQTALNQPSGVQAGATIWLLGGVYHGNYISNLNGSSTSPITVRAYPGQRATIDGQGGSNIALEILGSNSWYWGFEIIDTTDPRYNYANGIGPVAGIGVYGPGIKCINLVVHDTAEGFAAYTAAPATELTGNLDYYNGYLASDRNHGHGMYLQNDSGVKIVAKNFVGDNADEGMQIYGSNTAFVDGFSITGNTLYNTGSWPTPSFHFNLLLGGGASRQNIQVSNNYSYLTPSVNSGGVSLGQYTAGHDVTAQYNVFVGGNIATWVDGEAGPVVFTNNSVYAIPAASQLIQLGLFSGQSLASYTWDNNSYYGLNGFYFGSYDGNNLYPTTNGTFQNWQAVTGFDTHSSFTSNAPTGTWTYVQPNLYEPKRANITIYNWGLASTVPVDLSGVLAYGDQYVILDAQNVFGPSVASGVYTGGAVSVPMSGLIKEVPIGFSTPAHTAPQFGTFLLLPLSSALGVSITPVGTTLYQGQTVQLNATVQAQSTQSVSWSISPSVGSISSAGLYSAPAVIATAQTITVTAASTANPALSSTASIYLAPPIAVSINPSSATVNQGGTQQFTATVQNTLVPTVTWSISPNVGTISSSGLYTAPATITTAQSVTVTAQSTVNAAASSSVTVSLVPPVLMYVSPSAAALNPSQTLSLAATIQGGSNQPVIWQINPNVGTITSTGATTATYSAPTLITTGSIVTVTATSGSLVSTATITLTLTPLNAPSGLSLYWSFDYSDISGSQVTDLSGNNGTGSISGTPLVVTGELNQALSFDGATNSVSTAAYSAINFTNSITLSAWINTTNASRYEAIISKYNAGGSGSGYIFRTDQNGYLEVTIGAADLAAYPSTAIDTSKINDGKWHHVVAVVTIGQNVSFYVDGSLSSSTPISSVANGDGNAALFVGASSYTPFGADFTGKIDEIRIYNQALTASQVSVIYQSSGGPPPPIAVSIAPSLITLNHTQTQSFTATVLNSTDQSVSWQISPAGLGSISSTSSNAALYTPPGSITTSQSVVVTATSNVDTTKSGNSTVNLTTAVAAFVTPTDTTTQGNWIGKYGGDGYVIANGSQSIPPYATFAVQNQSNYTWAANTTDIRALETGNGSNRIAATWYSGTSFTFDINLTDGNSHPVALYALDWDNYGGGRSEQINVADGASGALLDTRSISSFQNGVYLVWNVTGHVKITVNNLISGNAAAISGVFFGGSPNQAAPTITWNTPLPITYGTALSGTQLNASASVAGTFAYSPVAGTVPFAGSQTLSVTFTPTDIIDYTNATGTTTLVVNRATPVITWNTPSPITYGVALSSTQLNATASVPGTFAYTPSSGTVLSPGVQTLSATLTPADTNDYNSVTTTVNLTVNQVTPTNQASFAGVDTATQGNWIGTYGGDGYAIPNGAQSVPSYATFSVSGQSSYTWAASTADVRAPQTPGGVGRIASLWFNAPSFTFDVNMKDGNTHQVALYALDWDGYQGGRAEQIQILDASTNNVLDTRNATSFQNGQYLVWNINGHVKIVVATTNPNSNAAISGVFFESSLIGVSVTPQGASLSGGQTQQYTAQVTGTPNKAVTWSISNASNPGNPAPGSISSSGLYTAPASVASAVNLTVTATASDNVTVGTATLFLTAGTASSGATATYAGLDATTQGSWIGTYGSDGYAIPNGAQSVPSYATFSMSGQSNYTWAGSTADVRALQTPGGASRMASLWFNTPSFIFDVNLKDGNTHEVALYALDWDGYQGGRAEQIQILDASTNNVLDTRNATGFQNGQYSGLEHQRAREDCRHHDKSKLERSHQRSVLRKLADWSERHAAECEPEWRANAAVHRTGYRNAE